MKKLFSIVLAALVTSVAAAAAEAREKTTVIVVHHSATDAGNVASFRRYHVEQKGWDDVGYHYVITNGRGGQDGKIQPGRPEHLVGAHALNGKPYSRNPFSVGVSLVGKNEFTHAQRFALFELLVRLCERYGIEPSAKTIQPHHRECPGHGLNLEPIIKEVHKVLEARK